MKRRKPAKADAPTVVVCGAGAAGMSAAIASARMGVSTILIEAKPETGGTVANCLIHTLAGLYDSSGHLLNGGLTAELEQRLIHADEQTVRRRMGSVWVLNVSPQTYRQVTRGWLADEPHLTVMTSTRVVGVEVDSHRITAVEVADGVGRRTISCGAVVDATGTGELIRTLDPELLEDEEDRSAGGLIFRLRGIPAGAVAFPRGIGIVRELRSAAEDGRLPKNCRHCWIDTGTFADEVYVKLFVPIAVEQDPEEISQTVRETRDSVISFLKTLPEFSQAWLAETGEIGVRDGGRILGEYRLAEIDVLEGRRFEGTACRGSWPIEYWHPEHGVEIVALPSGANYDIPLSALTLSGWSNVWMAGKCLSADRRAQSSARVAGTCWAMGEVVGTAAAENAIGVLTSESGSAFPRTGTNAAGPSGDSRSC